MQSTVTRNSRSGKSKPGAKKSKSPGGDKTPSGRSPATKRPKSGAPVKKRAVQTPSATPVKRKPLAKPVVMPKKSASVPPAAKKKTKPVKEKTLKPQKPSPAPVESSTKSEKRTFKRRVETAAEPLAPVRRRKKTSAASDSSAEIFSPSPAEDFSPVADFIEEDTLETIEDEEIVADDLELGSLDIPIELLDPDLVDIPKPAPPKPKPKPPASERRERTCASCGGMFFWLSVEGLCFSCLKRRLAQRRRDDETAPTYEAPSEEEDES